MRVGQTNRRGCSIVSRHPVKAVGAPLLAFLIVAMAEAAPPAIADEVPNRIRIEYALPKSQNYQPLVDRLKAIAPSIRCRRYLVRFDCRLTLI
jgi:hypothetical protein